ncbi:MAG: PD40 domain-containing protein [Bacteroidaceae bacterium]|nr:PD40 domain-containing protein [Bacteroidaceae bacterium]
MMTKNGAHIYPDYNGVTIPKNIAPMNFQIKEEGDEYITHIHLKGQDGFTVAGQTAQMDEDEWKSLTAQAEGKTINIDTYVKKGGKWTQYPAITMNVAEEIDPYITYRLIEPSYVNFEVMSINQRCLENFVEKEIYNTCTLQNDSNGQCINCHHAQNYNKDGKWQMHMRVGHGGTIIADGDNVKKVNLKTDKTISAGVYPAWHPTLDVIAYSNNTTGQVFRTADRNKIEVQDVASDLILYDNEKNTIQIIANDSTEWESFPAWAPDGKALYYVSATIPAISKDSINLYTYGNFKGIKYNIYRRSFNPQTRAFGDAELIYNAAEQNASATLPRISPDGKYLLFTQGEYGTFHIWHHDADLYLMDLSSNEVRPMSEINSKDTESYHSWSSNGRWIVFSSRRDDGSFTRPYIAYFGKDGKARKPFLLPQEDPFYNTTLFKSYNFPEFIVKPVETKRNTIVNAAKGDAIQAE